MFEVTLHRVPDANIWRSEGAETNQNAARLQKLFDDNTENGQAYAKELEALKRDGHQFRLTEGKVYQLFPSDEMIKCPVKLQVKEGVITWYFVAQHDVTHQEFRDEVYRSAALAHLRVAHACEKYLRGTNALHVKKMHTSEKESGLNHNHYRLMEGHDVTPEDLRQHLMGFVDAEQKLNIYTTGPDGQKIEKFLDREEAEEILRRYEIHWTRITHKGEEKTVIIHGETIHLPARDRSILEAYKAHELSKWDAEDWHEWEKYRHLEQPCKTIDPTAPIGEQLAAAEKGMRGLLSETAHQRQMPGSKFKVIKTNYKMDDAVQKVTVVAQAIPDIKNLPTDIPGQA